MATKRASAKREAPQQTTLNIDLGRDELAAPRSRKPSPATARARLRPRDEVEFDGMAAGYDASLFAPDCDPDLPVAPMQRVRARSEAKPGKTG